MHQSIAHIRIYTPRQRTASWHAKKEMPIAKSYMHCPRLQLCRRKGSRKRRGGGRNGSNCKYNRGNSNFSDAYNRGVLTKYMSLKIVHSTVFSCRAVCNQFQCMPLQFDAQLMTIFGILLFLKTKFGAYVR